MATFSRAQTNVPINQQTPTPTHPTRPPARPGRGRDFRVRTRASELRPRRLLYYFPSPPQECTRTGPDHGTPASTCATLSLGPNFGHGTARRTPRAVWSDPQQRCAIVLPSPRGCSRRCCSLSLLRHRHPRADAARPPRGVISDRQPLWFGPAAASAAALMLACDRVCGNRASLRTRSQAGCEAVSVARDSGPGADVTGASAGARTSAGIC